MRKIVLLIRRSKDYFINKKIDQDIISYFPSFKNNLAAWSLFFKMPYIKFRQRMSYISSLSYEKNNFDKIFMWGDYDSIREINEDDSFVVAVDEDDWLSPSLVEKITDFNIGSKKVIKWDVVNIDCKGISFIEKRNLVRSCGYATKLPFPIIYIKRNHLMTPKRKIMVKIDDVLSVKVDNVSSISYLWGNSISTVIEISRQKYFVNKTELLKEYWSLVDLYNELLNDLYKSCKL